MAPAKIFAAADVSSEGRFDLLGLGSDGQPIEGINRSTRNYHWQIIRPRALLAKGDQRINSFGVGGEIEIRSGLLVQMQPITGPQVISGWASKIAPMLRGFCGPMAPFAQNSRSKRTSRSSPNSGSRVLVLSSLHTTAPNWSL